MKTDFLFFDFVFVEKHHRIFKKKENKNKLFVVQHNGRVLKSRPPCALHQAQYLKIQKKMRKKNIPNNLKAKIYCFCNGKHPRAVACINCSLNAKINKTDGKAI